MACLCQSWTTVTTLETPFLLKQAMQGRQNAAHIAGGVPETRRDLRLGSTASPPMDSSGAGKVLDDDMHFDKPSPLRKEGGREMRFKLDRVPQSRAKDISCPCGRENSG